MTGVTSTPSGSCTATANTIRATAKPTPRRGHRRMFTGAELR